LLAPKNGSATDLPIPAVQPINTATPAETMAPGAKKKVVKKTVKKKATRKGTKRVA
jgi:hypothetical protein